MSKVIQIGDFIRVSVALIRDIHAQPGHESLLCVITDVKVEPDGSKVLVLTRPDYYAAQHGEPGEPEYHH